MHTNALKCKRVNLRYHVDVGLTFELHARAQALVEAAGGALLARGNGHRAAGAPQADVVLFVLNRALEEALAALAREDAVVEARDAVPAHGAGPA